MAVAKLPLPAVERLTALAAEICSVPGFTGEAEGGREAKGFVRSGGLNAAFPASMAWLWAGKPMRDFEELGEAVCWRLGRDYRLVAASFVVASGECRQEDAKFHLDFGYPQIPKFKALTALTPLHPREFPEREGNLQYRPWDADEQVLVHSYKRGEAAVFDGKLPHRTQPFAASAFQQGGGQLAGLRVLASLSFAHVPQGRAPWKRFVRAVLKNYGAPVPQCLKEAKRPTLELRPGERLDPSKLQLGKDGMSIEDLEASARKSMEERD